MKSSHFLIGWKPLWNTQERLPRSFVPPKTLGTEHVLLSLLADRGTLAEPKSWSLPALPFTEQDKGVPIASLRKNLEDKAGWDKMILKLSGVLYRAQNPNRQTMGNMMGMPQQVQVEVLKIIPVIWQKWRGQASLSLWLVRDAEISRMIQILSRKTKNNPVLVGEAGVGKTALALGPGPAGR